MFRYKEVKDPWVYLRQDLYKNVEPDVELVGHTSIWDTEEVNAIHPDRIPGYIARMSHQSEGTKVDDVRLTKSLLNMKPVPHTTPFEFMVWVFKITGVSKSCLTQFDRHRIASFVQMSKRYMDANKTGFVYNTYDYIKDEHRVRLLLEEFSLLNKTVSEMYNRHRELGSTKEDARKAYPINMSTGTYVIMNTVSIRNFFNLRLDKHAEWEIRRMAKLMWDKCVSKAPAHFQDLIKGMGNE